MRLEGEPRPQVMVIDDDEDSRELLGFILSQNDLDIVTASHGREALDYLLSASRTPDLILLDLVMPVMDGYAFREQQMGYGKLSRIPTVIMTASIARGFDNLECIVKPFQYFVLLDIIWQVLRANHS